MTNPSPEQIEAAYQAWLKFPHKRGPQNAENAIRAALVAAAGAAPQPSPTQSEAMAFKVAILAGVRKGAKSDAAAVRNYRESKRTIEAALPALRDYFRLVFASGVAPQSTETEEQYQAGCGSWDCRAPECGRA